MAIYLNTDAALENYKKLIKSAYFIDKSMILDKLNKLINTSDCYVCITKPRRFGKSSIINMLGAYYTKGHNSKDIFDKLNISKSNSYLENLNKYNVVNIPFNKMPEKCDNYNDYINMIIESIVNDIKELVVSNNNYIVLELTDNVTKHLIAFTGLNDYIMYVDIVTSNNDIDETILNTAEDIIRNAEYISKVDTLESTKKVDVADISIKAAEEYKKATNK